MRDETLEHYADVFEACGLADTGMTCEAFLRHPMGAIAAMPSGAAHRRWARGRSVSATELARSALDMPRYTGDAAGRLEGQAEHERFDAAVRVVFQGT